jgi:Tfp pilus assembly protein PilF
MPTRKKSTGLPLRSEQHVAALEEYEKGIRLFQQKDHAKAALRFEAVLQQFPQEAALGDRARTYLRICRPVGSQRQPLTQTRTPEQAFEVGVYLLNHGDYKEAARQFERAIEHDPKDPHIHVSLASARYGADDREGCMAALRQAIELDGRARVWIQAISDFDDLEDDDAFLEMLHGD